MFNAGSKTETFNNKFDAGHLVFNTKEKISESLN